MNDTDIVVSAGLDVSSVSGLQAVRKEISAAVAEATEDGLHLGLSAASKRLEALDALQALIQEGRGDTTKEQLVNLRAIRRYANIVSRHDFSTEAHKEMAALEEALNAEMSVIRTRARREDVLANTRAFREEDMATKRASAEKSARSLRYSVTRAMSEMEAGKGVWATDDQEAKLDELAVMKYNLNAWRRKATAASQTGLLSKEQVKYYNQQNEAIARQTKELKGINTNTANTWEGIKTITGLVGSGAAGIAIGNKISSAIEGIYGSETPFSQARKVGASFAKYAGGVGGALVGGLLGLLTGPLAPVMVPLLASVGGGVGAYAGGEKARAMAAASQAQSAATQQMRYQAMYRASAGRGGWQSAKMVESATGGMVGAGSIEGMASSAQEFQANVAFGEVSDSQWLGLAMLPNYYAAMMSGASPEEQIAALKQDTGSMSPGLQQFAMRHAGVPDDIRALINSPIYNDIMSGAIPAAASIAGELAPYQAGLVGAQYRLGVENRRATVSQARKASRSSSIYDYDASRGARDAGNEILDMWGYTDSGGIKNGVREAVDTLWQGSPALSKALPTAMTPDGQQLTRRELNIYIDNQPIATVDDVYTTEQVGDRVTYTAGGY